MPGSLQCIVDALVQAQRSTKLFMCRTFNLYMAKYILHLQNALPSLSRDSSWKEWKRGERRGGGGKEQDRDKMVEDQALARLAGGQLLAGC